MSGGNGGKPRHHNYQSTGEHALCVHIYNPDAGRALCGVAAPPKRRATDLRQVSCNNCKRVAGSSAASWWALVGSGL